MRKKIGVVLAGCGVYDGSEIHESVLTLLAIDRNGADAVCMAPSVEFAVVNHLDGKETGEKRNALVESARIARGAIRDIAKVTANEIDALIFPGGFGKAKTLCSFAEKGADAVLLPEVAKLLKDVFAARKPIGAMCIAPALLSVALGREHAPQLTIGTDEGTAAAINQTGSTHIACPVTEVVVDRENRIVTTPAYMLAERISEANEGIGKAVKALIEMA